MRDGAVTPAETAAIFAGRPRITARHLPIPTSEVGNLHFSTDEPAPAALDDDASRPLPRRVVPQIGARQYAEARAVKPKTSGRSLDFIASDETQDRYGDVIRADGWDLSAFKRNPVFLWAHQDKQTPIGRVDSIGVKGKQLIASVSFLTADENDYADKCWRLVQAGVLQAVSVGFIPTKPPNVRQTSDGEIIGYEFIAQELLELSLVSVPANPNALAVGRSLGLDDAALRSIFAAPSCRALPPQGDFSKQRAEANAAALAARRRRFAFI